MFFKIRKNCGICKGFTRIIVSYSELVIVSPDIFGWMWQSCEFHEKHIEIKSLGLFEITLIRFAPFARMNLINDKC